ncbi:hypothetical protein [Tardiphaga sp.]|jgi:hypothetical protein|uniref:hypothetical protein n=1 Tax=Tardiphaga sp. TaxID=1926292 RepID=UPI0037D9FC5B
MKTIKFLTAAVVATGLMATPVLAKDQDKHRAKAQADYNAQMSDSTYRDNGYRTGMRTSDSGFWPGDVAAGAVGGAVGIAGAAVSTAGAIATAPFRGWDNSYAYYDGPTDRYDSRDSYARRNNFVCQPGTWVRGENGQRHICQ